MRNILRYSGFEKNEIMGCQRYPLANHLYWLSKKKPGGHDQLRFLMSSQIDAVYESSLEKIDRTDSLIAICSNKIFIE